MVESSGALTVILYKYIWIPFLALLGKMFWDESWKRSFRDRIQTIETRLSVAETNIVLDARVREIAEETVSKLKEDYSELKVDFKEVAENVIELRIELASSSVGSPN